MKLISTITVLSMVLAAELTVAAPLQTRPRNQPEYELDCRHINPPIRAVLQLERGAGSAARLRGPVQVGFSRGEIICPLMPNKNGLLNCQGINPIHQPSGFKVSLQLQSQGMAELNIQVPIGTVQAQQMVKATCFASPAP